MEVACNDLMNGSTGDDFLIGGDSNESVNGGAVNDVIVGGHGAGDDIY